MGVAVSTKAVVAGVAVGEEEVVVVELKLTVVVGEGAVAVGQKVEEAGVVAAGLKLAVAAVVHAA